MSMHAGSKVNLIHPKDAYVAQQADESEVKGQSIY